MHWSDVRRRRTAASSAPARTALVVALALWSAAGARAQDVVSLKSGESGDLGAVYWQSRCIDILNKIVGVDVLEGPPGLTLSIREERVMAQRQNCLWPVSGGVVVATVTNVTAKYEGTLRYRVRYDTTEGQKQSTHERRILLFP